MDKHSYLVTQVKKERIKRQTSVKNKETDSQSGPGSMPGAEVCLFILSLFT